MKAHWQERITKIENLDDRRLFKDILETAFSQMEEYTQTQLEAIKQRVFDESKVTGSELDIYTAIVPIGDYDPINDFFYPMDEADLSTKLLDAEELFEMIKVGEEPSLGKLYFDVDFLELSQIQIMLETRKFEGSIKTDKNEYKIKTMLKPYKGYQKIIERFYELHLENDISWKSILHPAIHKFMEIKLISKIQIGLKEKIQEITIDFEEIESYRKINHIPLWNIKLLTFDHRGFPSPTLDRINYDHMISFAEEKRVVTPLIDGKEESHTIISVKREEKRVLLTTTRGTLTNWSIWQILTPIEKDLIETVHLSNVKKTSFIENHSKRSGTVIKTRGEIFRKSNLFLHGENVQLVDIIHLKKAPQLVDTYNLNGFMKDEVRTLDDKSVLKLVFKAQKLTTFTRDEISFLTSEIGMSFPEYRVIGVLK